MKMWPARASRATPPNPFGSPTHERPLHPRHLPLCERPIPPAQRDAHHLVPKSRGGRETAYLHRVCHRQIHALLTEAELARQYATVEALLAHPPIRAFVDWVRTKPDDFFVATRKSARVRRR